MMGRIRSIRWATGWAAVVSSALFLLGSAETQGGEYRVFDHIGEGMSDVFQGENLKLLGLATGLTLVSLYFDERVDRHFANHPGSMGKFGEWSLFSKREIVPGAIAASFLLYGQLTDHPKEIQSAQAQLEAIAGYAGSVAMLKFITHRNGPRGDSKRHAFPSGQTLFVTAGHLTRNYGWSYGFPVLLFGTIGVVDYVLRGGHWLSDLVFGSLFGFTVGAAYVDHHRDSGRQDPKLAFLPIIESGANGHAYGVGLQVSY